MIDTTSEPEAPQPMIGRGRELVQIDKLLAKQPPPTLIVVVAEASMVGKTRLLMEVEQRAKRWRTAFRDDDGELAVTADTTEVTFHDRVRQLLGLPDDEDDIKAVPSFSKFGNVEQGRISDRLSHQPAVDDIGAGDPVRPAVYGQEEGLRTHHEQEVSEAEPVANRTPDEHRATHSRLGQLLKRASRVRGNAILLLIDGYYPEEEFGQWFTTRFLPDIKQEGARVLVIVALRHGDQEKLGPFADATISLGPLDRDEVRDHLLALSEKLDPPIEEKELKTYVEKACEEPEILDRLIHVLKELAQPVEKWSLAIEATG